MSFGGRRSDLSSGRAGADGHARLLARVEQSPARGPLVGCARRAIEVVRCRAKPAGAWGLSLLTPTQIGFVSNRQVHRPAKSGRRSTPTLWGAKICIALGRRVRCNQNLTVKVQNRGFAFRAL